MRTSLEKSQSISLVHDWNILIIANIMLSSLESACCWSIPIKHTDLLWVAQKTMD